MEHATTRSAWAWSRPIPSSSRRCAIARLECTDDPPAGPPVGVTRGRGGAMMHPPVRRTFALVLLLFLCLPVHALAAAAAAGAGERGDFNGDGYADLAAGVPGDDSAETG